MAAAKFWTRKKFKGTNALKRRINPTRVPIEGKESMRWLENLRQSTELLDDPARCVHSCDREGDIWELFCLARELDTHFLIRRCSDRFAGDGSHAVASIMAEEKVRGVHSVAVRDDKGKLGSTQVELSYRRMTIRPPIAKQKRYPALMLTVLHAREPEEPVGRPRIDWKLITDLPVDGHDAAVEKLQWYAMRCVAFGDVAGPGMVDQPFGQRQQQKQVALGDGDEAVAQTVEPELTDHRLIPSLRCGVFRRRVSTQQFVDPSTQLVGDLLRERPCGDTGALRQEPLQDFRFDPRLRHKRLHRRGRGREADHAQTLIHGRGPRSVWSTRRRECYDVSVAGACSFNINASIRSAILCAGSRNWPMVQSAA